LSSGTACDVTNSANSLHDRAGELMMFDVISHVDSCLPRVIVSFVSSVTVDRDAGSGIHIGSITEAGSSENDFSFVGLP